MSTLYVVEPGARLEKEYGRLLVTDEDEVLMRVPLARVSRVVLVGWAGATTPALLALLAAGIPLVFVRRSGELQGQLRPPMAANLPLRRAQYDRDGDSTFCLDLSRAVVGGKLRNQRTLARRLVRRHPHLDDGPLVALERGISQSSRAPDLATLRGIEGTAARAYFRLYRAAFDPDWRFRNRNRRPPRDPANALLSLGYTLLTQSLMTALELAGLDPYLGYYHAETYGRPALALDLLEEFRTPVVDSLVLDLTSQRVLQPDDFETDAETGGVVLRPRPLNRFLRRFSRQLESERLVRDVGRRLSYRKLFEVQARRLARVVQGQDGSYRPFIAR